MLSLQATILLCVHGFIMMSPLFKAILKLTLESNKRIYFLAVLSSSMFYLTEDKIIKQCFNQISLKE